MFENPILKAWLNEYSKENELEGNSSLDNERRYKIKGCGAGVCRALQRGQSGQNHNKR